jgi:hypothetical protein
MKLWINMYIFGIPKVLPGWPEIFDRDETPILFATWTENDPVKVQILSLNLGENQVSFYQDEC